ncbi:mitotic checkpoint regulator, MAD2B-interacting-domain-containing protein [Lipomyces kononenkoae]|uniref:Mitotic checkpoint regulator, MAD2B-interacting-domain-containing protein n=1 Tax=Lipomyces kononenkoae TaxID=34357 RepID=A0ACC3SZF3_LIPKO
MSLPVSTDTPISNNGTVKRTTIQPFFAVKKKAKTKIKSGSTSDKDDSAKDDSNKSLAPDLHEKRDDFRRQEKRTTTEAPVERTSDDPIPMKKRKSRLAGMSLDLGLVGETNKPPRALTTLGGTYQPLLLPDLSERSEPVEDKGSFNDQMTNMNSLPVEAASNNAAQDLKSIAEEIGLSDSNLQILEGRHRKKDQPIRIVNYSVDEQYSYNKSLIASGAAQTVQPVRTIGSGKHQLRGLINSATQQREGLEEAFASGRRNKRESGAKYGF